MAIEPVTREEMLLNAVTTGVSSGIEPITREEKYLAYIGGQDVVTPEPITRKEQFLSMISPGGGSGVTIKNQDKTVTENGTYTADIGYTGLGNVIVNVPIPGGGDDNSVFHALVNGTLSEIEDSSIEIVKNYGFAYCEELKVIDLPNVKTIKPNAFYNAGFNSNVTHFYMPNVEDIGTNAFYMLNKTGEFPDVVLPKLLTMGAYAFFGRQMPTFEAPMLKEINQEVFGGSNVNGKLTKINIPSVTTVKYRGLYKCVGIEKIDLPSVTKIESYALQSCCSLKAVLLRSTESVCTLSNTNAFTSCYHILGTVHSTYNPDGLADGYIYVPSALVDSYKAATNWVTYADQIRALEDYTVDGTITGEIDAAKMGVTV